MITWPISKMVLTLVRRVVTNDSIPYAYFSPSGGHLCYFQSIWLGLRQGRASPVALFKWHMQGVYNLWDCYRIVYIQIVILAQFC